MAATDQDLVVAGAYLVTMVPLVLVGIWVTLKLVAAEIDMLLAIGTLAMCACVAYLAIKPPAPLFGLLTAGLAWGSLIGYPIISAIFRNRELRQVDIDELEKAYVNLGLRPNDPSSKFRVAESVSRLGDSEWASWLGEKAVEGLDKAIFDGERRLVVQWAYSRKTANPTRKIECRQCGVSCTMIDFFCPYCGERIVLATFAGASGSTMSKRILISWLAGVFTLLVLAGLAPLLPPMAALLLSLLLIGAVVALLIFVWKPVRSAQ